MLPQVTHYLQFGHQGLENIFVGVGIQSFNGHCGLGFILFDSWTHFIIGHTITVQFLDNEMIISTFAISTISTHLHSKKEERLNVKNVFFVNNYLDIYSDRKQSPPWPCRMPRLLSACPRWASRSGTQWSCRRGGDRSGNVSHHSNNLSPFIVWQFDRVGQIHDQSVGEDLVRESRGRCAGINWFRISVDEELQLRLRQQFLGVLEIFTINRYFDKDMVDGYYFVLLEVVECESHHHEHSDEKKWQSHEHRFTNFAGVCHIKIF